VSFQTTDLCDAFDAEIEVVEPMLRSYGGARAAGGPIRTLKLFEDNALVRETLATPGKGAMLVIDGGGACGERFWGINSQNSRSRMAGPV